MATKYRITLVVVDQTPEIPYADDGELEEELRRVVQGDLCLGVEEMRVERITDESSNQ